MIIKHKNFLDVAFLVTDGLWTRDGVQFKGEWLNQGFVSSWPLGIRGSFNVPVSELINWQRCVNPNANCLRYEKWVQL